MRYTVLFLLAVPCYAQMTGASDRLAQAFQDRILTESTSDLNTDEHISMYETLVKAQPDVLHYQNLLAGAYIQKVRESMDYSYLERASQILNSVLGADPKNYEAARLRTEIALERHDFRAAADYSRKLTDWSPNDPWNWGTLGDALTESGDYENAGDAYQKMVSLRPDLSSYNRAAYFRFLYGDVENAVKIMKMAISAGSPIAENTAWCEVELGRIYLKTGKVKEAGEAFLAALRRFPNYHTALAGLAQTAAAKGDWKNAILYMQRAQAATPLPDYAAALYDYYTASGDAKEAARQKELILVIDQTGQAAKERANRNIALIYADHDWNLDRALELAKNELEVRGDIYTYDALAWALYKNKQYAEAGVAMKKAMQLGTPEPMFRYHAGLIESALSKTFTDTSLNATQRNTACLALRGNQSPEVMAAMRSALSNPKLQACAGVNLRIGGAQGELLSALEDKDPTVRAVAARELGATQNHEFLAPLRKAAEDRDLLVASNAVEGLVRFEDHASIPQLREIALLGGVLTSLAVDTLVDWHDPEVLGIARKLVTRKEPGDQLIGVRVIGLTGDATICQS